MSQADRLGKWHLDEDSTPRKFGQDCADILELTFILLARPADISGPSRAVLSSEELEKCRMVGDVNMFLPDGKEGEGECEIMIASKSNLSFSVTSMSLIRLGLC